MKICYALDAQMRSSDFRRSCSPHFIYLTRTQRIPMNPLSIFLVIITALSWSLSNILGKMLMREMNPTLYSALRLLFAATAFTPVILVNGPRFSEALVSLAPFALLSIPLGFLFSILMIREKPDLKSTFGMALVFCGVVLAAV